MNQHHLELLKQGAQTWNKHRNETGETAELAGATLDNIQIYKADLSHSNFNGASFVNATMNGVDFSGSDLGGAFAPESDFSGCIFENSNLKGAKFFRSKLDAARFKGAQVDTETDLSMCNLSLADMTNLQASGISMCFSLLSSANLSGADFSRADLSQVVLVNATVEGTRFTHARVHGLSAWDLKGQPKDETDLVITRAGDSSVTVDDLEVAQFVYLILNNQKIRDVIDTVTTKTVLILGRFSQDRKRILDAIREQLGKRNYVGIIFDFDPSDHRNLTETVSTLAHMARFIIADITHARSIGQELTHIIPQLPSVPVQPIVNKSDQEWAMFRNLKVGGNVLPTFRYSDLEDVLQSLEERILGPVDDWFRNAEIDEVELLKKQLRDKERELQEKMASIERLQQAANLRITRDE